MKHRVEHETYTAISIQHKIFSEIIIHARRAKTCTASYVVCLTQTNAPYLKPNQ